MIMDVDGTALASEMLRPQEYIACWLFGLDVLTEAEL